MIQAESDRHFVQSTPQDHQHNESPCEQSCPLDHQHIDEDSNDEPDPWADLDIDGISISETRNKQLLETAANNRQTALQRRERLHMSKYDERLVRLNKLRALQRRELMHMSKQDSKQPFRQSGEQNGGGESIFSLDSMGPWTPSESDCPSALVSLGPWTPCESAGPGPPSKINKGRSSSCVLPPTIIVEDASFERIGSVIVRKSRKVGYPKRPKKSDHSNEMDTPVEINKWEPGTSRQRIDNFKFLAGSSKYAKLHKINDAHVEKAASKMDAKLSVSNSAEVLSITGNNKLFLKVSKPNLE